MAEGVLGLGTGQASSLNQELIDKLKAAERKATVEPIETSLKDLDEEGVKVANIKLQVQDVLDAIKPFDLFVVGGVNAFSQKSATTTGDSVVFDAVDASKLNTGTTNVSVSQIAQRDVYQTSTFTDKDAIISTVPGSVITINGAEYSTFNKTYQEVADKINFSSKLNASIEAVGTDSYRMVIKSEDSGVDNALSITQTSVDLGLNNFISSSTIASGTIPNSGLSLTLNGTTFTTSGNETNSQFISRINADPSFAAGINADGKVIITRSDGGAVEVTNDDLGLNLTNENHTLTAQNMKAKIDGVDYDVSSNVVTVDGGLKISATKVGDSSISIEKDKSQIATMFKDFIDKFNTLSKAIDAELYSGDSKVQDRSTLRDIQSQIKNMMFKNYGQDSNDGTDGNPVKEGSLNLFNFGLEVDKNGNYSLNESDFNKAVSDDFDNLKDLFIGTAEKEGFGTQLKTIVDAMDGTDGAITTYENNMTSRKKELDKQLKEETESLDSKYSQLANQFSAYGVIINQFNAQFSSLEMMINQSTSK